ncbi:type II toxin-antitoxin system RatA family toxin [Rhodoblastus sp. 17X3]|uniref:type II toxin-antitoxin system RatA family toxin n=1 Tax=Rhodoblastus sp. 17X3 TaxID=3047026 RepID=UPI0024B7EE3C|nr:type II toxin-antitoxin system RatA family toxin [Rhodoblastus sp. 17X3]MDI9848754.1 type II toxin-antitoxin system RatA family toxin [Rhodoblastus sp. 17X3]
MRRKFTKFFPHDAPSRLFALVNDIESYPAFIPHCRRARILSRDGGVRRVENAFGLGPLRLSFVSEAREDPPRELVIQSRLGALRAFRLRWLFEPEGEGCLLSCDLDLEFSSSVLNALAPLAASEFERSVIVAFERRAAALRLQKEPT